MVYEELYDETILAFTLNQPLNCDTVVLAMSTRISSLYLYKSETCFIYQGHSCSTAATLDL